MEVRATALEADEAVETAASPRSLEGEKAIRIVEAMRESVAEVGVAGSTFERVAAKAGVSRGLLHYYFGTKERLLVEVIRLLPDLGFEGKAPAEPKGEVEPTPARA